MNSELEERIRAVYPKGYLEVMEVDKCDFSYVNPVEQALRNRLGAVGAGVDEMMIWSQLERVAGCLIGLCAADGIFWKAGQTSAIQLNARLFETKAPGIVFILKISTVFPAWSCYFNLWTPRVDAKPDDPFANHPTCASFNESDLPHDWSPIMQVISDCCALHGLVRLSKSELMEAVPFVTESMWADDDFREETEEDFDGFSPSPIQDVCNVDQCLFQQH